MNLFRKSLLFLISLTAPLFAAAHKVKSAEETVEFQPGAPIPAHFNLCGISLEEAYTRDEIESLSIISFFSGKEVNSWPPLKKHQIFDFYHDLEKEQNIDGEEDDEKEPKKKKPIEYIKDGKLHVKWIISFLGRERIKYYCVSQKKKFDTFSGDKQQEKVMKTEEEDKFYGSEMRGEWRMIKERFYTINKGKFKDYIQSETDKRSIPPGEIKQELISLIPKRLEEIEKKTGIDFSVYRHCKEMIDQKKLEKEINWTIFFSDEITVDMISNSKYKISIEKNRVPLFKKLSIEGKYPRIQGNYVVTDQVAYMISPFSKIGQVEGRNPVIKGNYLVTNKAVYTLSPFEKIDQQVEGKYPTIKGNYLVTTQAVYTLSPFKKLGQVEGTIPHIQKGYLITTKAIYILSPFEKLPIEGHHPRIKGNYLVTNKAVYTLSPFEKLLIEGHRPVIKGNYLVTNKAVYTLSPFEKIDQVEGNIPQIEKGYLTTTQAIYILSPFKKLPIEGDHPRIKGNYLVTNKAIYTLSPFKKLGQVGGTVPQIEKGYLITTQAIYILSPFKKLPIEGTFPKIKGNYLVTNKALYTLSPFKKIGQVEGNIPQIEDNYLVTDEAIYTLSPFKKLPIEGDYPRIIGEYLVIGKSIYAFPILQKLDIERNFYRQMEANYLVADQAAYIIDRLKNPKKPTTPYLSLRQRFAALGALLERKEVTYMQYEMYDPPSMKSSKEKIDRSTTYSDKKKKRKKWLLDHFKEEEINTKWLQEDIVRDKEGNIYTRKNFPDIIKGLICCEYLALHGAKNHELVLGT